MTSIFGASQQDLQEWLKAAGEKPFRAEQLFSWIFQKRATSWDQMTNLSAALRLSLSEAFTIAPLKCSRRLVAEDDQTIKYLWELEDKTFVESVLILAPERRTICVSSQVGCNAKCAFCASGKQGLKRNLSAAEIIQQFLLIDADLAQKGEHLTHVVFMGMGEPLDNYEEVVKTIRILIDPKGINLSQRRITLSTVGVVEGIRKLMGEDLKINVALSLHAPNQQIRKKIIPYARKYELSDVLSAISDYSRATKRDITYEYTLISGINDQEEHAHELVKLIKGQQCSVNLIPYNPVFGLRLKRPEKEEIERFEEILAEAKIPTTRRFTKGTKIAAACGQLALQTVESIESTFKTAAEAGI